jgi:hypothetical protein
VLRCAELFSPTNKDEKKWCLHYFLRIIKSELHTPKILISSFYSVGLFVIITIFRCRSIAVECCCYYDPTQEYNMLLIINLFDFLKHGWVIAAAASERLIILNLVSFLICLMVHSLFFDLD